MDNRTCWTRLGQQASQNLFACSAFVARTEFLWQDPRQVADAEAWQRVWFELEILNAVALAEWEEQGRPAEWSSGWAGVYREPVAALVEELLALLLDDGPSGA